MLVPELWFKAPAAFALTAGALGVVLSTVYTQNHYAIDLLAGVVWALGLQIAVAPAIVRWWVVRRDVQ